MSLKRIIDCNCAQLECGADIIRGLSNDLFTKVQRPLLQSGIGPHVRHIIEHYDCFRGGFESRRVAYPDRPRDTRTELDASYAVSRLTDIVEWLETIPLADNVSFEVIHEPTIESANANSSSLGRELEFLLSHAAHHFAMIAVILRANNVDVPDDFGLAPSTRTFRQANSGQSSTVASA